MKRTSLIASLAMVAVLGGSLGAMAHGKDGGMRGKGPRGPMIEFSVLDANGDGQITQAELDAQKTARFAEIDANGDGNVSAEELLAHAEEKGEERKEGRKEKMAERMIDKLDENDDGLVSAEEFTAKNDRKSMIDRLDENEDGSISEEEFNAMKERFEERKKDREEKMNKKKDG